MRRIFRGMALALALSLVMALGGCAGKEPTGETVEPEITPAAPGKTLYQQGEKLAAEIVEMAGSRDYLSLYTGDGEVLGVLSQAVEGKDYTTPKTVYSLKISDSATEKILKALEIENVDGLPDRLKEKVQERTFQALSTQVNAMSGTTALAATSICTASKVFVNPEVTEGVIYLYTYENGEPIAVTFLPGEDGAVSASGTFLLNDRFQMDSLEEMSGLLGMLGVEITEVTGG